MCPATPCNCNVYGATLGTYTYTGTATQSAWAVHVAANPTRTVAYDFLVLEPSTTGVYHVDRLSLGTGFMFTYEVFSS